MLTKNDKGGREGKTKGDKRMAEGIREGSPQKFAEMICEQPPRAVRTLAMFKPLGRGLSYWSALTPAHFLFEPFPYNVAGLPGVDMASNPAQWPSKTAQY